MKKALTLILALTLVLACFAHAYADSVSPCASAGHNISATVSVGDGSGKAVVSVKLLSGYSASTTMCVQKQVNGVWSTIKTVTGTTKLTATFSTCSGVSYRVYVISNITKTDTGIVECVKQYSTPKSY